MQPQHYSQERHHSDSLVHVHLRTIGQPQLNRACSDTFRSGRCVQRPRRLAIPDIERLGNDQLCKDLDSEVVRA